MNNAIELPRYAVSEHDHKVTTTSLMVAEVFEKRHDHVLRDIQKINAPKSGAIEERGLPKFGESYDPVAEFWRLNFEPRTYVNEQNKAQPMVEMTKDGFTLLVMGYGGEKALLFKIAYIAEFNRMAALLAGDDYRRAGIAEARYFERYPTNRLIRAKAMSGEPYWYIAKLAGCAAATVGNAVRRMVRWGLIDARLLKSARSGCGKLWAARRKFHNQLDFGF